VTNRLIKLVEEVAIERGDESVPRDYIVEALEKIELGDIEVKRYPTGLPTLKGVYEIASKLYKENRPMNKS